MANHRQAEKRNRQRIKRSAHNRVFRATMRTHIKRVRTAVEKKDAKEAQEALAAAVPMIDRCAGKGIVARGSASRMVSRLSKSVYQIAQ